MIESYINVINHKGEDKMKENLCIPIYLNEKIVFDLLAIIEDGFSKISEVKTSNSNQNDVNGEVDASLKSSGILSSLFGITLSSKVNSGIKNAENAECKQEKVHTNVSLFSKLRKTLINEQVIKNNLRIENIKIGDFIEVEGILNKNPMVDTMETFIEIFKTFSGFIEEPKVGNKNGYKKIKSDNEKVFEQMEILYKDLIKTNTMDLIVNIEDDNNTKVLLSTQLNYFIDGFESDLVDGHYRILGKVIKIAKKEEAINLFRKTSFKIFENTVINTLIEGLNHSIGDNESGMGGIKIPKIISEVEGPCMIIIPVAIYA